MSLPKPYYEKDGITIYHADCRDILSHLPKVDLVLTDPPYGISIRARVNYPEIQKWDSEIADISQVLGSCKRAVIWGAQYYAHALPVSEAWLAWVKRPPQGIEKAQDHTTVEYAWSNFGKPRFIFHVWDGGKRAGDPQNRLFCHPAQKPTEVMNWCIPQDAEDVLDPFMGSGTTLVAAKKLNRRAIGIEIEERYCEIAVKRLAQGVLGI